MACSTRDLAAAAASRSPGSDISLRTLNQWHEAYGDHCLCRAVGGEALEVLVAGAPHWAHEDALGGGLLHQRRGWLAVRRGGHGNAPERGLVGGALAAVAGPHFDVVVAQLAEHVPRPVGQRGEALDRDHL